MSSEISPFQPRPKAVCKRSIPTVIPLVDVAEANSVVARIRLKLDISGKTLSILFNEFTALRNIRLNIVGLNCVELPTAVNQDDSELFRGARILSVFEKLVVLGPANLPTA